MQLLLARLGRWLAVAVLATGLAACGGSDDDPAPSPTPTPPPAVRAETTLLVYMVGSDLESNGDAATVNIEEMQRVAFDDRVNVILATGGADKPGWETLKRQRVRQGKLEELDDLGAVDMSRPETLADFIEWAVKAYPAERYHLALWNHGGGPNGGFGHDEVSGTPAMMSMPQMQDALARAQSRTGVHFGLIGFDACLMASVEVAEALAPHASYLLASQELEPGAGWDWEVLLSQLASNPAIDPLTLGTHVVDGFFSKLEKTSEDDMATLAVIDLSRIPALVSALERASNTLSARLTDEGVLAWNDIAYARRASVDFMSARFVGQAADLVDIGSFMWMPQLMLPQHEIEAVQSTLADAVRYQRFGPRRSATSGLTMYFPVLSLHHAHVLDSYQQLRFAAPVKGLVSRYTQLASTGQLPTPVIQAPRLIGDEVAALATGGAASTFAALVNDDGLIYALKPVDGNPTPPDDSMQNGQPHYAIGASVRNGWFSIDSLPVLLLPDEHQFAVDSGRFSIPVGIIGSDDGEDYVQAKGFLMVDFQHDIGKAPSYRVDGFHSSYDGDSMVAARPQPLPAGVRLAPMGLHTFGNITWMESLHPLGTFLSRDTIEDDWQLEISTFQGSAKDVRLGINDFQARVLLSPPLQ